MTGDASGWQPIHVAAFAAASLAVLAGTLTMQQAYRAIEWRAIFLVAAVLPVGVAMERTGAAELLAQSVTAAAPLGPHAILAALVILAFTTGSAVQWIGRTFTHDGAALLAAFASGAS